MGDLYKTIKLLCDERGIKPATMCRELGISTGLPTDLKAGRKKTVSAPIASKIANYFGITVQELLGEAQKESASPDKSNEALFLFSQLSEKDRQTAIDVMRGLIAAQGKQ